MATTDTWIGAASADWGASAANWSTGLPTSSSNVNISTASPLTITYSSFDNFTVNSLSVGTDRFDMSGGSLTVLTPSSFADGFTQTSGTLSVDGAMTVSGAATLIGGSAEGKTVFNITGTISLANYELGGSAVLNNATTASETAQITLGDTTGANATINNEKGAAFNINGDYGIGEGASTAGFVNAGTLAKTGGIGTSIIAVDVTDTGSIAVSLGTLEFEGPTNSFAGAISGAGQFALGAGKDAIKSGAAIMAGTFGIYNGTQVTLGEALSYAGLFDLKNSAAVNLGGYTLTLAGTDTFSGAATVDGAGTLVTAKGGAASIDFFTLGGTVNWQNSGSVDEVVLLTIGDSSTNAAAFTNESGGIYEFAADTGIGRGTATTSSLVNLAGGLLEKTGGTGGTSIVAVDVTDTGSIAVSQGTLEFEGPASSFAGAISGAGQFALGGGNDAIKSGAAITTGTFGIYNGTLVTLGEALNYAGLFDLENLAAVNLGGYTLTLLGTDTFSDSATVDGTGTLVTAKGGVSNLDFFTLGGTADWQNSGTVDAIGQLTLGDRSTSAATFTNESGGVYEFAADTGIGIGAATTSSFVNLAGGLLEKTGGTGGTSIVAVDVTDSGSIAVSLGTLEFEGPASSFAGVISGPGQFALGGGNDAIKSGAAITAGTFGIYNGTTVVTLGEKLSYVGLFDLETSGTVDLGGYTLTLSGTDTLSNSATVDGAGALVTAKGGVAGVDFFTLGGTADWQNSGIIDALGELTIGNRSTSAATFTNESGGIYEFTADTGIGVGAATTSSFVNLAGGLLEKTGGTGGASIIAVDAADSGSTAVNLGTLEFEGPTSSFAGMISGPGQFALGGGADAIKSGAAITTGTFSILDSGTVVTLGEQLSYLGLFDLENSAAVNLGGYTLTLRGTDTLSGSATVDGGGALVTAKGGVASVDFFTLGGTVDWQNSGTVDAIGQLTLGDSTYNTVTIVNETGGIYAFTADTGIGRGTALNSSFVNLTGGLLEKTGNTGTSIIAADVTDNGAITVGSGTLEFEGIASSFAGAISGVGQFALGAGGSDLIASGATITTGTFGISDSGTLVMLGEQLSYAGLFELENSATVDLGGYTLTLSGTDSLSNYATVDGTGTLVTAKGAAASVGFSTLGGAVDWQNSGTVDGVGPLTIGDSGFGSATFTNESGGVYVLNDDYGIGIGAVSTSSFINLAGGLLEKTAGTGDSTIAVVVTNDGAVEVASGTLEFQNAVSGAGTFTLEPGTVLQFDTTVAKGLSIDFAGTTGGDLVLTDSQQFAASIHGFGGTNTDELELRDINFASTKFKLSYSGSSTQGVLAVTDGTHAADLTMFGNYTSANFHASADGDGTKIFDPPSHPLLAFAHG